MTIPFRLRFTGFGNMAGSPVANFVSLPSPEFYFCGYMPLEDFEYCIVNLKFEAVDGGLELLENVVDVRGNYMGVPRLLAAGRE